MPGSKGRFIGVVCVLVLILSLFAGSLAPAATIRVTWSLPDADDIAGYRLRYGTDGDTYPDGVYITDPEIETYIFDNLPVGITHFFKMQSVDTSGLRSTYSNVTTATFPWDEEADPPDVPAIVGLSLPEFDFYWNVAGIVGAAGAGLEVSLVNECFANPNGYEREPEHCCFVKYLDSPLGSSSMSAASFQGPGLYEIRIIALNEYKHIICRFSDSAFLEVIQGVPGTPELIVTGPGPGRDNPPLVRSFDPSASFAEPLLEFPAYGAERYGVNVAAGDVIGDGRLEIITGPGPGEIFGPQVRVFDDAGHSLSADFHAYGTMRWGVKCTTGDIDGDLVDEIITAPGPGPDFGPHVRGWDYDGKGRFQAIPQVSFMAYGTLKYGANAACGDIDGDGIDEIVTGAGPGVVFGPHVRGWNIDGGEATAMPGVNFFAYGTNQFGVNVSCGDLDGDGFDEIVTGAGPGVMFGPHVRAFDYDGINLASLPGASFFAGDETERFGVNVSCGDIDGDGVDEIVTAPGPGPDELYTARIRGWNYHAGTVNPISGLDFVAYDDEYIFGARVAVGRGVN